MHLPVAADIEDVVGDAKCLLLHLVLLLFLLVYLSDSISIEVVIAFSIDAAVALNLGSLLTILAGSSAISNLPLLRQLGGDVKAAG